MTVEEVKKVIVAYNEYDSTNPLSPSWCEHAEAEDWEEYWDSTAKAVYKNVIKADNSHNIA